MSALTPLLAHRIASMIWRIMEMATCAGAHTMNLRRHVMGLATTVGGGTCLARGALRPELRFIWPQDVGHILLLL